MQWEGEKAVQEVGETIKEKWRDVNLSGNFAKYQSRYKS